MDKLEEIGRRTGVDREDIRMIRKKSRLVRIFAPVIGSLLVILSTILGRISGRNAAPKVIYEKVYNEDSYPYCAASFMLLGAVGAVTTKGAISRKKRYIIIIALLTVIMSVIGFAVAYNNFRPVEYKKVLIDDGIAIMYGVYSRNDDR